MPKMGVAEIWASEVPVRVSSPHWTKKWVLPCEPLATIVSHGVSPPCVEG